MCHNIEVILFLDTCDNIPYFVSVVFLLLEQADRALRNVGKTNLLKRQNNILWKHKNTIWYGFIFRVNANCMISTRASITQNNFSSMFADFAKILMFLGFTFFLFQFLDFPCLFQSNFLFICSSSGSKQTKS